jgi:hypothetical protein
MRSEHLVRWKCTTKQHDEVFETRSAMEDHLLAKHTGSFNVDMLTYLVDACRYTLGSLFTACPFCDTQSKELEGHITSHLRYIASRSLPWPEDEDDTLDTSSELSSKDVFLGKTGAGEHDGQNTDSAAARNELMKSDTLSFDDPEPTESDRSLENLDGEFIDWTGIRIRNSSSLPDDTLASFARKFKEIQLEKSQYRRNDGSFKNGLPIEPVPWDSAVQLIAPGFKTDTLNPPKPPSSTASHNSVVNDLGDARYHADLRTSRDSRASTDEVLVHSGAGLPVTIDRPEHRETDVPGQGDATRRQKVEGNWKDQFTDVEPLGESIRAALQVSQTKERGKFLPNDALDKIVTRERIYSELRNYNLDFRSPALLDFLADKIWEVTRPRGKETTRRRIFAILGLIEQCGDIVDFIQDDLYDSDLPFILSDSEHTGRPQLCRKEKNGGLIPIEFLKKWRIPVRESFNYNQWQLIAPYFQLLTDSNRKVLHYPLADQIILPFIEDDEVVRGASHAAGGFGDVWRVKIHPAHHNYCEDTVRFCLARLYV